MRDVPARASYRLSPAQTRTFFGDLLFGGDEGLNLEQVVCHSTEALDLAAFRQAWQTVLDRHAALRAGFKRDEQDRPYQEIHPPMELPVAVEDARHIPLSARETFVEEWLEQDRRRCFDLAAPPLMRVTVIRLADDAQVWVWTFHHILLDGRSIFLVLEDFFAGYEAARAGRPVALPERRPFSDFMAWHEDWLASQQKAAAAYWRQCFTQDETDSVLSISRLSSSTGHEQKKIDLELDAKTSEGLQRLAKDFDLTLHTIVQGAWALLLSRYYRSNAVTFTTILSCRQGSMEGTEGMIGMLMNQLPVHVVIGDDLPVVDFLQAIRKQQLATRSYQWTPADVLRNAMPIAASKQFFDSCILYERYHLAQEMTARFGQDGARTFSLRERSNVPLLLSASERPHLQFELIYQVRLFAAEEIAQLGRSFLALLRHILATPHAPVGTMELLDSADKASVIARLTGPELAVPEDKGLHHWFEDQVKRTPDALAVVGEINLTYAQLDDEANKLAARLIAMGVAADQLVVVFLNRSAMTIVALLGILKSGAAYFAIDVTIPKARLSALLEDARPVAVITDETLARTLPALSVPLVLVDGKGEALAPSSRQELPRIRGSQLAYVIYTSGTTGRPKLIAVEHRQTAHLLAYATQCLLQPEDVRCVPFIDAPSADSSVSQIFVTLALGGTLILVPEILEIKFSPYYEKFTCLGTLHSLLSIILNAVGLPPSVRLIGLGAETIPAQLLERLDGMAQIKKVINYYGPTETTVYCTAALLLDRAHPQERIELHNRGRVIGRPIANTRIYLVDESGQLVPPGAMGEIHIAGALVARGYLKPAGTESAHFQPDRFGPKAGERMYRSGDLARLRTDGQLEFHGRKDHQLKFNGVRIEAAEIENALLSVPGVRQAVVDLRPEAGGKNRLVAYLVAAGEHFQKQKLRKVLRLLLPGAMIPQHFIVVGQMPLTANGKVDREALARLELGVETSAQPGSPATPVEKQMLEIWERNLARGSLGLEHDYFELGGDSLSSINLLLAIEKQFGLRLKPQVLVESSTITDLARVVEATLHTAPSPRPAEPSSFLALQESGNRTPLILIPGGSGEGLLSYRKFAHGFFPDYPVHALPSPYQPMLDEPADPVAHLSAHFARQIVSLVKDRPFVLFGHCVGGLLAWHVACALKSQPCPPFKLVLYDAPVPQRGINVRPQPTETAPQSRWRRFTEAYQLAWADWSLRNDDTWRAKARFLLWAVNNAFMRKGLDRSASGRDDFAKLAYLRALQSCALSNYTGDALLLYHHFQAEAVSRSHWHAHATGNIQFEFVAGSHTDWESAIGHTTALVRHQLETVPAREPVSAANDHAPAVSSR